MEILSGIAAVSQGITIAKTLRAIEKTFDEATYKAKISDIIDSLTDAKLALSNAKQILAEKDLEIERLKKNFQLRAKLVSGNGDYKYIANDAGELLGYPICPKCEVLNGRIVQLKQDVGMVNAKCPACSENFRPVTRYFTQAERDAQRTVLD